MKVRFWAYSFLFITLAGLPSVWADAGLRLFERAQSHFLSSREVKAKGIKKKNYLKAASDFRKFLDLYPKHEKRVEALFHLGSMYSELAVLQESSEYGQNALDFYRGAVRSFPQHTLADDALFEIANLCKDVFSDFRCHHDALDQIRREYPAGDMAARIGYVKPSQNVDLIEVLDDGSPAEVLKTNIFHENGEIVVKLTLNKAVQFKSTFLKGIPQNGKSPRFFVDVENARLPATVRRSFRPEVSEILNVRLGQNTPKKFRLVLDLSKNIRKEDFQVRNQGTSILIGIRSSKALVPTLAKKEKLSREIKTKAERSIKEETPPVGTSSISYKRIRIVIDPGHGGDDAGARGRYGTLEKDVALAVSKRLKRILDRKSKYEVFMTRTKDRTLSLLDRTNFANSMDGDLFVSIHANASPKRSARGVSTYFLHNADDQESLRVAMRENGELDVTQATSPQIPEKYYLEVMKASMVKNFHTVQSTDLATHIQGSLLKGLRRRYKNIIDLGVRSARFYVLTGAKMPAILVETSFISNPMEERRLRNPRYQQALSEAIFYGVQTYIQSAKKSRNQAFLSPQ